MKNTRQAQYMSRKRYYVPKSEIRRAYNEGDGKHPGSGVVNGILKESDLDD